MTRSRIALEGLPHSEISGSKPVCGSPELIAAYHVLHRRPAPRHPPYALSSLTTTFTLLKTSCFCCLLSICCTAIFGFDAKLQLFRIFGCQGAAGKLARFSAAADATDRRSRRSRDPIAGFGGWWSWPGSNRRLPPCKGGALPAELQPQEARFGRRLVGLSGFEPLTSRLSAVRSSQLSYRPVVATWRPSARPPRI